MGRKTNIKALLLSGVILLTFMFSLSVTVFLGALGVYGGFSNLTTGAVVLIVIATILTVGILSLLIKSVYLMLNAKVVTKNEAIKEVQ